MGRFINYIRDTKAELSHVKWPTRRQAVSFTVLVILASIFTALLLAFFDYLLSLFIQKFVI